MPVRVLAIACFFVALLWGCDDGGSDDPPNGFNPPPPATNTCDIKIPDEQPPVVRQQENPYPSPPAGYGAVIGWANVVIGKATYGLDGTVTIDKLEIWERVGGVDRLLTDKILCLSCANPNDKIWGYLVAKSDWAKPAAWDKPNEGSQFTITPEGYLLVNAGQHPDMIYHFWNTNWPRSVTTAGATYYVKSRVKVEGNAMIQIGLDYWQRTDGGINVEAGYSNWQCASPEWIEIKAGAF